MPPKKNKALEPQQAPSGASTTNSSEQPTSPPPPSTAYNGVPASQWQVLFNTWALDVDGKRKKFPKEFLQEAASRKLSTDLPRDLLQLDLLVFNRTWLSIQDQKSNDESSDSDDDEEGGCNVKEQDFLNAIISFDCLRASMDIIQTLTPDQADNHEIVRLITHAMVLLHVLFDITMVPDHESGQEKEFLDIMTTILTMPKASPVLLGMSCGILSAYVTVSNWQRDQALGSDIPSVLEIVWNTLTGHAQNNTDKTEEAFTTLSRLVMRLCSPDAPVQDFTLSTLSPLLNKMLGFNSEIVKQCAFCALISVRAFRKESNMAVLTNLSAALQFALDSDNLVLISGAFVFLNHMFELQNRDDDDDSSESVVSVDVAILRCLPKTLLQTNLMVLMGVYKLIHTIGQHGTEAQVQALLQPSLVSRMISHTQHEETNIRIACLGAIVNLASPLVQGGQNVWNTSTTTKHALERFIDHGVLRALTANLQPGENPRVQQQTIVTLMSFFFAMRSEGIGLPEYIADVHPELVTAIASLSEDPPNDVIREGATMLYHTFFNNDGAEVFLEEPPPLRLGWRSLRG